MKQSRSMALVRMILKVLLCMAVLLPWAASALDAPALTGRVNDYAGMLSPDGKRRIETLMKELEDHDSTQVVVLTVPSLAGDTIEDFSIRVAERWKIGRKGFDNGVILVVARDDRKVRIEVGYGLEAHMTDLTAGRIIRDRISPEFRAGRFDQGMLQGVTAIAEAVRGEFQTQPQNGPAASSPEGIMPFVLIFIFVVFMLGRVSRLMGTVGGGFFMPFLGQMAFAPGLLGLLGLSGLGLVVGYVLASIAGAAGPGGPRYPGGGIGRGGGLGGFPIIFPRGGGGFSSGGGGFSGGGGGFGGGGASGSW